MNLYSQMVRSLALSVYLTSVNFLSRRSIRNIDADLIVSLTTFHKRIDSVFLTIESIFAQTGVIFEVHLHLSSVDIAKIGGVLPASIERLRARGLRIFCHTENLMSYKKLHYTLHEFGSKMVITADDDVFYPRTWLRELVAASGKHPGCVVCYRGHDLQVDAQGKMKSYNDSVDAGAISAANPSYSLMPTGVSGVLYPPGSLAIDLLDPSLFMSLAPTSDDVWFKLCSLRRGVQCVRVFERNVDFLSTPKSQTHALHIDNVGAGQNDLQIRACFERYPDLLDRLRT